jgi:choline dehydrogenase-like flavoprotein
LVDPNFLAHPDDLRISTEGVKLSREIFSQPSLQKYIRAIRFPDDTVRTQAEFEVYARQYGRTSYHPVSTCRMGQDEMAVVDPQLRVRGLDGLRICDSSVMPSLIGSNTNAPTIMIGERAADLIRGNH